MFWRTFMFFWKSLFFGKLLVTFLVLQLLGGNSIFFRGSKTTNFNLRRLPFTTVKSFQCDRSIRKHEKVLRLRLNTTNWKINERGKPNDAPPPNLQLLIMRFSLKWTWSITYETPSLTPPPWHPLPPLRHHIMWFSFKWTCNLWSMARSPL